MSVLEVSVGMGLAFFNAARHVGRQHVRVQLDVVAAALPVVAGAREQVVDGVAPVPVEIELVQHRVDHWSADEAALEALPEKQRARAVPTAAISAQPAVSSAKDAAINAPPSSRAKRRMFSHPGAPGK